MTFRGRHCSPRALGNPHFRPDSAFYEPAVPQAPCTSVVSSYGRPLAKMISQADSFLRTRSSSFTQCSGYTSLSQPVRFLPPATTSFGQSSPSSPQLACLLEVHGMPVLGRLAHHMRGSPRVQTVVRGSGVPRLESSSPDKHLSELETPAIFHLFTLFHSIDSSPSSAIFHLSPHPLAKCQSYQINQTLPIPQFW